MKKRTKVIIALAAACAGTFVLGACSSEDIYADLHEQGYKYTVIFDSNGGMLASNSNVQIKYHLHEDDVAAGKKIYQPNDRTVFGNDASTCSRDEYFLAGWYRYREDRKNSNGEPLDDFGDVCKEVPVTEKDENGVQQPVLDERGEPVTQFLSENNLAPGYTYKDPWDFSKAVTASDFNVDSNDDGTMDTLLLYACWVPNYQYRIHWTSSNGESGIRTISFNPSIETEKEEIAVPTFGSEEEKNVTMTYGDFPQIAGKTFSAAYQDAAKTQKVESLKHEGYIDEGSGVCVNGIIDYYADFIEGDWRHIYSALDLASNMVLRGCYEIYNDLDFSEVRWTVLNSFGGEFHGNGHTIRNVTVTTEDTNASKGGLFGSIIDNALFEDITFENVIYTLAKGTRQDTGLFGLLAGEVSADAEFKNTTISGTFYIGCEPDSYPPFISQSEHAYHVGILSGNGTAESKVEYHIELKGIGNIDPKLNDDGTITITVK